jgi:T-complex protein 1 subunit beta
MDSFLNAGLLFTLQDKILQSFGQNTDIQVTNDGATILKSIGIDNPAAKVLVG